MAKPKMLTNRLTGWFGIVCPKRLMKDEKYYLLVSLMPLSTLIMVKKLL